MNLPICVSFLIFTCISPIKILKRRSKYFKKVFRKLAIVAFVFGATVKTDFIKNLVNACSYVCCAHNGDEWGN